MAEEVGKLAVGTPEQLKKLVENMGTIAAGLVVVSLNNFY